MQIEDLLLMKDFYLSLEGPAKKPSMTDEERSLLDRKALIVIRLTLTSSMAFNASEKKDRKGSYGCTEKAL